MKVEPFSASLTTMPSPRRSSKLLDDAAHDHGRASDPWRSNAHHRDALSAASRPLFVSSGRERSSACSIVFGREHAEDHGHASAELHVLDATRTLAGHELVVPGVAANDRAERDHRVVGPFGVGVGEGREWDLEGAGHPGDTEMSLRSTPASSSAVRAPSSRPRRDAPLNCAQTSATRSPRPDGSASRNSPARSRSRSTTSGSRVVSLLDVIESLEQMAHSFALGSQVVDVERRRAAL